VEYGDPHPEPRFLPIAALDELRTIIGENEKIHEVEIYTRKIVGHDARRGYLLFRTDRWWYSAEKEGKGLIIQRSSSSDDIKRKEAMRCRISGKEVFCGKLVAAKTINEMIECINLINGMREIWADIDKDKFVQGVVGYLTNLAML
jgi:hypothetical protein